MMQNSGQLHPMYSIFSGIGRLLVKVFVIIMKIMGITLILTLIGFYLGVLFEMQNSFAIILNNGFYFLGFDLQYNFSEAFAAIGFLLGFISSGIMTILNLFVPPRVDPVAAQLPSPTVRSSSDKDFDTSQIALHVPMVDNALETKLYRLGINTVPNLANAKPEELASLVGSPEIAKLLIADAQKVLDVLFRDLPT